MCILEKLDREVQKKLKSSIIPIRQSPHPTIFAFHGFGYQSQPQSKILNGKFQKQTIHTFYLGHHFAQLHELTPSSHPILGCKSSLGPANPQCIGYLSAHQPLSSRPASITSTVVVLQCLCPCNHYFTKQWPQSRREMMLAIQIFSYCKKF